MRRTTSDVTPLNVAGFGGRLPDSSMQRTPRSWQSSRDGLHASCIDYCEASFIGIHGMFIGYQKVVRSRDGDAGSQRMLNRLVSAGVGYQLTPSWHWLQTTRRKPLFGVRYLSQSQRSRLWTIKGLYARGVALYTQLHSSSQSHNRITSLNDLSSSNG